MERLLRLLHKRGHWYALGLVVAVALFSAAACSTALGITRVGITEREVMAGASFDGGSNEDFDYFVSVDGGETWRPTDALTDVQLTDVQWSEGPVDTPRGTFSIEGPDIVLTPPNGVADTVFSASDWRTSSNRWFQKSQTHDLRGRLLSKGPVAIAYDPASDNVIAAAGIMGAVVGTPDGQWTAVAVGNYSPLVFSRSAKLKTLLSQHVFWATVITFPLLMIALAFCFKDLAHKGFQTSKYEGRIDTTASPSHDLRPFTTSYLDYYDRRGLGLPLQTAAYRESATRCGVCYFRHFLIDVLFFGGIHVGIGFRRQQRYMVLAAGGDPGGGVGNGLHPRVAWAVESSLGRVGRELSGDGRYCRLAILGLGADGTASGCP